MIEFVQVYLQLKNLYIYKFIFFLKKRNIKKRNKGMFLSISYMII
jgi:hypothetical protein